MPSKYTCDGQIDYGGPRAQWACTLILVKQL